MTSLGRFGVAPTRSSTSWPTGTTRVARSAAGSSARRASSSSYGHSTNTAGWISHYTIYPDDGLDVWRCTMFRNEGSVVSSSLIVAAMTVTAELWGDPPIDGWCTYVDTAKVKGPNPGYCFKRAGWRLDHGYQPDRRRASLIRLRAGGDTR